MSRNFFSHKFLAVISTAVIIAASSPVSAQIAPGAPANNDTVPEKMQQPTDQGRSAAPGATLSKKLDQTNGVMAPSKDVDPGMRKAAPDINTGGSIVTPPSSSGGSVNIQPK